MTLERTGDYRPITHPPHTNGAVVGCADKSSAVWSERNTGDLVGVAVKRGSSRSAVMRVPQSDSPVGGSRGDESAVGRERHAVDPAGMTVQRAQ
ncbi:hypothetical protein RSOLAG1IB_09044 [Rhizoctonia solani AG-1 IB]|uniref:Uncharacterized protein n=1 Tax=Thanatephorus cucumeris (strain AG1-IB / isolate 7/3/14) TaxID=1108050 RepID=A0A0B7FSB5_THACB|nr:hypothetical protein RSOLAG1IB_09044 [Rhizoctonia solani AG-1 IB]